MKNKAIAIAVAFVLRILQCSGVEMRKIYYARIIFSIL